MNTSQSEIDDLSFTDYFYVVKRYRKEFVILFFICIISGFLYKNYSARINIVEAKLMLRGYESKRDELSQKSSYHIESNALSHSAQMISKKDVLYFKLLKNLKAIPVEEMSDHAEVGMMELPQLKSMIQIQSNKDNIDILEIIVKSGLSENTVKIICKAYLKGLIEELKDFIANEKRQKLKTLEGLAQLEEQKVKNLNNQIHARIKGDLKNGVHSSFSNDPKQFMNLVLMYENQIQTTKLRKKELLEIINSMRVELKIKDIPLNKIQWVDSSNPMYKKLEDLTFQKGELLNKYQPSNPSVIKLNHQIQVIKKKLKSQNNEEGIRYVSVGKLKAGMVSELRNYNAEFKRTDSKIKNIESSIAELHKKILNGTDGNNDQKLIAQKNMSEELLKDLRKKTQEIEISIKTAQSQVKIFQSPGLLENTELTVITYSLSLCVIALFISFGLCLFLFGREKNILEFWDLKRHFPFPGLANIPVWFEENHYADPDNPLGVSHESYSQLKNNIEFKLSGEASNGMLISSANEGEGKSTTAKNLALSFAIEGNNVLLISCDLRNRNAFEHLVNEADNPEGYDLEKYLKGEIHLEKVFQKTFLDNLFVVPTLSHSKNSTALLKSDAFKEFIEMNLKEFDIVILDGPSAHAHIDALVCSHIVKNVILVVECASTLITEVDKTLTRFDQYGANVRGLVLNKAKG